MIYIIILSVILCVICAGFVSALETATAAATPGNIQNIFKHDKTKLNLALKLMKKKQNIVSTLLICYTLLSTIATILATNIFIKFLGQELGTIASSIFMSSMIIIFSEALPKRLAIENADSIFSSFLYFLDIIIAIHAPINWVLDKITLVFIRIFGIKKSSSISAAEEIKNIIQYQHFLGSVVKEYKNMLDGVVDIYALNVEDVMIHRSHIFSIDIGIGVKAVIDRALSGHYSKVPIWRNSEDNIIGVIDIKSLYKEIYKHNFDINKIEKKNFISDPWFIPENASISKQLKAFLEKKNHFAVVVDEYGALQGILTLEDIIEEIVGPIEDEHDVDKKEIINLGKNQYKVKGFTSIRDVNRIIDIELPEEESSTLAGMITDILQYVPEEGQEIKIHNVKMIVKKKDGYKIEDILVFKNS